MGAKVGPTGEESGAGYKGAEGDVELVSEEGAGGEAGEGESGGEGEIEEGEVVEHEGCK